MREMETFWNEARKELCSLSDCAMMKTRSNRKSNSLRSCKFFSILILCIFALSCASSQTKLAQKRVLEIQDQFERAVVAMNYDLVDKAIEHLSHVLSLDPDHHPALYLLGLAHTKKRNYEEAASAFEKSLELNPDNSEAHVRLGDVYRRLDLPDKAEEEYKKAYDIDKSYLASFNLAMLYYEKRDLDLALDYAQRSIRQDSRSVQAYNLQGVVLNEQGRYPEAIASFRYVLALEPNNISGAMNLAVAYINNKDFDKAHELLQRILPHAQDQGLKDRINEYLEKIKRLKKR